MKPNHDALRADRPARKGREFFFFIKSAT